MRTIEKRNILVVGLCVVFVFSLQAQVKEFGIPFITNFQKSDYHGSTQNWAIVQDNNQFLYVANNNGILEFDGNYWNLYPVPNNSIIRSLCCGWDNKIYAGAHNEFGYLEKHENGELQYKSLLHLLPKEFHDFNEVWRIFSIDKDIFFQSFNYLFRLRDNKLEVLLSNKNFHFSFLIDKKLYLLEVGKGLFCMDNGNYKMLPGGDFFADMRIWTMIEFAPEKILIGTAENGLYLYSQNEISRWGNRELTQKLSRDRIFSGTKIGENYFAFGTVQDGVVIANKKGNIVQHLNRDCGLQNNTVLWVFADANKNLWLGLDNGIDYVQTNSSISYLYPKKQLGAGYALQKYNGKFYVGTNQGLFFNAEDSNSTVSTSYTNYSIVEGTNGQVWSLFVHDGLLFCGHDKGTFIVKDGSAQKISDIQGGWNFMKIPGFNNIILQGTYNGLVRYKKTGSSWAYDITYDSFNESCREMEFDADRNLWIGHGLKGIYKVTFDNKFEKIIATGFLNSKTGFPSDFGNTVMKFDGNIYFSTEQGQYTFDASTKQVIPSNWLNNIVGHEKITSMMGDDQGRYWYFQNQEVSMAQRKFDGTYRTEKLPFNLLKGTLLWTYEDILFIDQENVLINSEDGYIHFNPMYPKRAIDDFATVIRRVESLADSIFYNGNEKHEEKLVLNFEHNNTRFRFTALNFESIHKIQFRHKLEGFDEEWSAWGTKTYKEYTNLPEGDYTFVVESKDVHGTQGKPAIFNVEILPPWYRTTLAWIIYGAILFALILLIIKYYIKRFEQEKKILKQKQEKEIAEKEKEFEQQKTIAEQEIIELRNEKLQIENEKNKAELENRSKELATIAMQITYKNEVLNNIKNRLAKVITKMIHEDSKKQVDSLIHTIEKDLAHKEDWEKFEVHFDQVHEDFIKKLNEQYHELSPKDLKMCAYLRMNLSTKEIAQLLNITVRGVEISRYRLRKKLNLDRETNLTEFLLRYK